MLRGALVAVLGLGLGLARTGEATGSFAAWWNIPLNKCTNKGVLFDLDPYNIIHNVDNTNSGDKVNIYYRPGVFPWYDENDQPVNGGIPQQGNITQHIALFSQQLMDTEPTGFSGVSVLDFEKYLPAYNGYVPKVQRQASDQWVRDRRPELDEAQVKEASALTFDVTVKPFFKSILKKNREMYPEALIGYYKYPPCNNWDYPYNVCTPEILELNDNLHDTIYNESTAFFPSVYAFQHHEELYLDYLTAVLNETIRVNINALPVYPYYHYRYHDPATDYLTDEEAIVSLWTIKAYGMDGVVLWGSSYDIDTVEECEVFRDYVYSFLGPLLKCLDELPPVKISEVSKQYPPSGGSSAADRSEIARLVRELCELK